METLVRQLVADFIEHELRLQAKLRHLVGELSEGALLEGKLDRTVRQRRKVIVDVVDQLVAKPPPLFCVKVKSHEGYLPWIADCRFPILDRDFSRRHRHRGRRSY